MKRCPVCGHFMAFQMKYVAGQPVVTWYCSCGYDTSQERIFATNHTVVKQEVNSYGGQVYSSGGSEGILP